MKILLTALAVTLVAALAPTAHAAAILISYQIDANPVITCAATIPSPVVCADVTTGPVLISGFSAQSNSPGTPTLADLLGTVLSISNPTSAAHSLTLTFDSQGFTAPTAPPLVTFLSHIGGTVANGATGSTIAFQSCVDPTNSTTACTGASTHSGVGTPIIGITGSFADDKSGTIASLSGTYSISQTANLALGAGAILNLSTSTTLSSAAVPEPTTMLLLGTGLLGFALARKRLFQK